MSFILDALRKSEIERQRQSGPNMAEFPIAREDRRLPIALIAIGALLALNAAVVVFFMLRDSRDTAAETTRAAAAAPSSATSPPAAAASSAQLPETQSALQAAASPQDEFAQSPVEMYGEQATLPPDAPDPTLVPDAPLSRPGVTYGQAPPDDAPAAVAATGLAELTIDLHIYTDDARQARRVHQWPPLHAGRPHRRGSNRRGDHERRRGAFLPGPPLPPAATLKATRA